MAGISCDDENALQMLREKLARREREQEMMKSVNAYYRKHGTLDGCPLLSAEEVEKMKASIARDWRANPKPYDSYLLDNNNQKIHSVKARIAELEAKQNSPAPEGWSFEGGRIVMNQEENRVQILFDGKPDADIRSELKHAGFRWAPDRPQKKFTPEYQKIASKLEYIRKRLKTTEGEEKSELLHRREVLRKELLKTPCKSQTDKKLKYVRYADDFLIGVNGSKENCAQIKRQLSEFIAGTLKMELSGEKTLITHSNEYARFLGYDVRVRRNGQIKHGEPGSRFCAMIK